MSCGFMLVVTDEGYFYIPRKQRTRDSGMRARRERARAEPSLDAPPVAGLEAMKAAVAGVFFADDALVAHKYFHGFRPQKEWPQGRPAAIFYSLPRRTPSMTSLRFRA